MSFTMVQTNIHSSFAVLSSCTPDLLAHQILFLNKNDLFEKKITHSDIKNFFPVSHHVFNVAHGLDHSPHFRRITMENVGTYGLVEITLRNGLLG
jgi:hypothetical protein